MTKKKKTVCLLGSSLIFLSAFSCLASTTKMFTDFSFGNSNGDNVAGEDFDINPVNGIKFANEKLVTNEDGTVTRNMDYQIFPAQSTEVLNAQLTWSEANNSYFEESFLSTEIISDYITFTDDSANRKLSFTCLKPFGRQAIFKLTSQSDTTISASITIDYLRKTIKDTTLNMPSTVLEGGKPLTVTYETAVYSIGSKGERPNYALPSISSSFAENGDYTFNSLFSEVVTNGLYTQAYKYEDRDYYDPSSLQSVIKDRLKTYFFSMPTLDGSKTFDTEVFRNILTYQACTYHTNQNQYQNQTNIYEYFISRYESSLLNNAGLMVKATYQGKTIEKLISLGISTQAVTGIQLTENFDF